MSWLDATRARLRLLLTRDAVERRMDDEIGFHIDMEAKRLAREEGLDAGEARRRALVAFGGVERHKEALRADRGLAWLGGLSLDFKLAFRSSASSRTSAWGTWRRWGGRRGSTCRRRRGPRGAVARCT